MSSDQLVQERIAIIGVGLSLPGHAEDLESFWSLLDNKVDATIDIPEDRWDIKRFYAPFESEKPGKMYVKRGGFLQKKVDSFDPLYFGISPREASIMDAQQKLLLEISAKTFQDAGYPSHQYDGANVGVFIGGFCMDSHVQAANVDNRNWHITQSVTGSTATMLSNRISYIFNLKGPSLTIDTACSSSLVAAHYAAESILSGECETALVGGVNLMTQPEHFIEMCKGKLLSKDGKCFTWDERANGYCRGEGAGMLMFKKLSLAQKDGDNIYAILESSGINQDGTTQGITSPNPDSQASLIERVLNKAQLSPHDIDYIEAHGTGTQAGDKAETTALNNVFNHGREDKLLIGSVKTNIGHLEAAAGVSGLLKSILCLQKGKVPANLHFDTPNPDIPFSDMCFQVPTETVALPNNPQKRKYVSVNGFGYGGTNCHVILGEAPSVAESTPDTVSSVDSTYVFLPLSAKCDASLKSLAQQYVSFLNHNPDITLAQFAQRIALKRTHYDFRAFIYAEDREAALTRLTSLANGDYTNGLTLSNKPASEEPLVFVYSGMGPQWWGMGKELLDSEPLFAEKITEYDAVFQKISGWSLLAELRASETASKVSQTQFAQPLNFAIQAALTEVWLSWGITPSAVVGHSVGEVTSAYISGILSLEDALSVSYHRSYLQSTLANTGGMLAVGLSEQAVIPFLQDYRSSVSIAAINSPSAVTLAGDLSALASLADIFEQEGIFRRSLNVEVPYHSPLMAPIEDDIKQSLSHVSPQKSSIPCYSTVTGELATLTDYDADYWWSNVRESVFFSKAMTQLCDDGFTHFLEVGPHPVLNASMKEVLAEKNREGCVFSSLNRKTPEQETLFNALAEMYISGHNLDWQSLSTGQAVFFTLPSYPWQKTNYSYGSPKFIQDKFGEGQHPILYRNLMLPYPSWEVELNDLFFPYVKDHKIGGKIILPGAFYIEAALAAAKQLSQKEVLSLKNVSFDRILSVPESENEEEKRIISTCTPEKTGFAIYSTTTALEEIWTPHMKGDLSIDTQMRGVLSIPNVDDFDPVDVDSFYSDIAGNGLEYGHYFRPIRCLKNQGDYVYAEIENTLDDSNASQYILPPPVLDGIFQTMFAFGDDFNVPFVPVNIEHLTIQGQVTQQCKVVGQLLWMSSTSLKANFTLYDQNDVVIMSMQGVSCQALSQMGDDKKEAPQYHMVWNESDLLEEDKAQRENEQQLVISSHSSIEHVVVEHLENNNTVDLLDAADFSKESLIERLESTPLDTLFYLCDTQVSLDDALHQAIEHSTRITEIVQALHYSQNNTTTELIICTRSAAKVIDDDRIDGVSLSCLAGLARTINTEHPHILCSVIDIDSQTLLDVSALCHVLSIAEPGIQELAIRGEAVFQHQLQILERENDDIESTLSRIGQKVLVEDFANIEHQEFPFHGVDRVDPTNTLKANEVEIEIDYLTLSHRDAINAKLTMYPDDPAKDFFHYTVGSQSVAYIVNKGESVSEYSDGDQVLAIYPHGMTNFSVVPKEYVFAVPEALHNVNLPDICEIFLARYATSVLGAIGKGSTILIQGIWGAFSETLIHSCLEAGSDIIFLDENPSLLGAQDLASFNNVIVIDGSHDHHQALLSLNKGIDIIINAGLSDTKGLTQLNPFGRVIDFKANQIPRTSHGLLSPSSYTYTLIDINRVFSEQFDFVSHTIVSILNDLVVNMDHYSATPAFDFSSLASVSPELKKGAIASAHILMKNQTVPLVLDVETQTLSLNGTYIVTGGTQGFGLQCAQHLVNSGARSLVLMSRRGLTNHKAIDVVNHLRAEGISVNICAVDITDINALTREIQGLSKDIPEIKGVIHSAMVLEDAYLEQMNESMYQRVLTPKIQGAINLSLLTENLNLDFFMMFSSISSLIGNAGQGNYVSANSFLDGFAHYLTSRGVPAKTINWGALSDSGVLADNESLVKVLALAGIYGVSNQQAMKAFDDIVNANDPQVGVFSIDWSQWSKSNPSLSQSNFFENLADGEDDSEEYQKLMEVLANILDKDEQERIDYVQKELSIKFGEIFKMSPEAINPHTSIIDLGVDSLMSVEISLALKSEFGVDIPSIDLISGPSIASLANKILAQFEVFIEEALAEQDDGNDEIEASPEDEQLMAASA